MAKTAQNIAVPSDLDGQILQSTDETGLTADNVDIFEAEDGTFYREIGGKTVHTTIDKIRLMGGTGIADANPNIQYLTHYNDCPGTWVVDEDDTTSDDNTGTILVTAGGKRLKRKFNELVNVEWFGAINDASTDNTDAINNALTYLDSLPGTKTLYFPAGAGFLVKDTINALGVQLSMDSNLLYDGDNDRTALIIGSDDSTTSLKHKIRVVNNNYSDWTNSDCVGIEIKNYYYSDINIILCNGFTIGVKCEGTGKGFVYNIIRLGAIVNNNIAIVLTTESNGWVNENIFIGGRFGSPVLHPGISRYGIKITGNNYNNNNNVFYKPCFELGLTDAQNGNTDGEAIPVVVEYGSLNAFFDCRCENVSNVWIRSQNNSFANEFHAGVGNGGTIDDSGTIPTTIISDRNSQMEKGYFNVFYNSGKLSERINKYDTNNFFAQDELFFARNAAGISETSQDTWVSVDNDYIEFLANTHAIGVRINTSEIKRFVVKKDALAGYYGRIVIRCYDSSGNQLTGSDPNYVLGSNATNYTYNAAYGGCYIIGSDSSINNFLAFNDDVAYADIMFSNGTAHLKLRSFQIQGVDGISSIINYKTKKGPFATQAPDSGTWDAGTVVWNDDADGSTLGWVCTDAGTPGTWSRIAIGAHTLDDVLTAGKTTTQIPSVGGLVIPSIKSATYLGTDADGNIEAKDAPDNSFATKITQVTADYTCLTDDDVILITADSADIAITIPAASTANENKIYKYSFTNPNGKQISFTATSQGTLYIDSTGTGNLTIISDGSKWWKLNQG